MNRALLLNASYEPMAIVKGHRIVKLYMKGKVDPIEYSGEVWSSPTTQILIPSVMRLRKYVVLPDKQRTVQLIPRNVCARDEYICAYCGGRATTMDHVIPRAKGGKNTWENVTAACEKCNHKKGDRTLSEMAAKYGPEKWTLRRECPRPVRTLTDDPDPCWIPYLQVESFPVRAGAGVSSVAS